MSEHITPVPGDPSTEPVATAEQSHVDGRVGPPTIAQDATAVHYAPGHVEQIEPGAVLPASTPFEGGPIATGEGDYAGPDRPTVVISDADGTSAAAPAADVVVDEGVGQPASSYTAIEPVVAAPVKPAPGDSVVAEPVTQPAVVVEPDTATSEPATPPATDSRA